MVCEEIQEGGSITVDENLVLLGRIHVIGFYLSCFAKVFELGVDGGDNETDGELLAETEEIPYECGAR